MRQSALAWTILLLAYCLIAPAWAGRFETFSKKAAAGAKLTLAATTTFGGRGDFQFVSAGELADGTIVAFGDAWGPQFPSDAPALVLGRGRHQGLDAYLPERAGKKPALREDDPDAAGMILYYSSRLAGLRKVVRFDWGVASFSTGLVLPDGRGLLVAGRCTDRFQDAVRNRVRAEPMPPRSVAGPYQYGPVRASGDVFIARLPAGGDGVLWAIVFRGARIPPRELWTDYQGNIYADIRGMTRISPDGQVATRIATAIQTADGRSHLRTYTSMRSAAYLAVDPNDGSFYYGGDRYTNTGFEPWRQPYVYKFAADGQRLWKLWDWPAKDVGTGGDGIGLCGNARVRTMDIAPDGTLLIGVESDGPNSVFTRQPQMLDRRVRLRGFGMDDSGIKKPTPLCTILRFDPKRHRVIDGTLFQAYVPESSRDRRHRDQPSAVRIGQVKCLSDGSIAFTGMAGPGLIETPYPRRLPEAEPVTESGAFVAAFSPDFHNLLFSRYLPTDENARIQAVPHGLILIGRKRRPADALHHLPQAYEGCILLFTLPSK